VDAASKVMNGGVNAKFNCPNGQHNYNKTCRKNSDYCKDFDPITQNCMRCEWYSFFVKNEGKNANVTGKGNYCENRWWLWILMILGALFLIGLLIGVLCYCCSKKKEKVIEQEPLVVRKQNVFVQKAKPVEHHYVHQEPVVYYQSHDHHESREGERVLVETRTYSPDREAKVQYHDHQDWARYSQANWKNHN